MKKKIMILGGAFLASLVIVFVVLFTTSGTNYSGAIEKADKLLASKDIVAEVLNGQVTDYSKFDESKLNEYSEKVLELESEVKDLQSDKACATKFKSDCDAIVESYDKLKLSADSTAIIVKFVKESQDIAGISNDTLSEMKGSSNTYLQTLANDLSDYRAAVDAFSEKYVANADDADFVADYSTVDDKYRALKEKYSSIKSDQLFGASNEELLSFYDKIEELKKRFAEEK